MKNNFQKINIKTFSFMYFISYFMSKITLGRVRLKYRAKVKRCRKIMDEVNRLIGNGAL